MTDMKKPVQLSDEFFQCVILRRKTGDEAYTYIAIDDKAAPRIKFVESYDINLFSSVMSVHHIVRSDCVVPFPPRCDGQSTSYISVHCFSTERRYDCAESRL